MQLKYYFAVLCVSLMFGLSVLVALSCKSGKADVPGPEPADIHQVSEAEDAGVPAEAAMVLNTEEKQDIILAAYKDPAYRDDVVAFFRDLTGSENVAEAVLSNAAALDVLPALAFSLCAEESNYKIRAFNKNLNNTVDRGLFQLNSATFPELSAEDFFDPGINAARGLSHLRWCLNTAGTEVAGLAMYNAGTTRVRAAGTPKSTLDYISRILKRQRKIEELFIAEYARITQPEEVIEPEEEKT